MALNISEAHWVNTLADWLLPEASRSKYMGGPRPSGTQARDALAQLADKAHKALSAGIDGEEVRRRWWAPTVEQRRIPDPPDEEPPPDGHVWADVTCECQGTLTEHWRVALPEPIPSDQGELYDLAFGLLNGDGVAEYLDQSSSDEHDRDVVSVEVDQ